MAYVIITPFQDASPGVFPPQNNENFQRLRDIINNDHYFSDSFATAQGIHKQVTTINRDDPAALPFGNGILYSKDVSGFSQLKWYNGSSTVQLTPGVQIIQGTTAINNMVTTAIYADPGFSYQAFCWLRETIPTTNGQNVSTAFLLQAADTGVATLNTFTGNNFVYVGNVLSIANTSGTNKTYKWMLQVTRLD